ncbi:MAG: hypothetical protein LBL34_06755 [Clostridiales bacterium]|nr:hypothetical protein [Clostridiales bacterium]
MYYDFYFDDTEKIFHSRYHSSLHWKDGKKIDGNDYKHDDPTKLVDNKITIATRIADHYSVSKKFCRVLLETINLATPPLDEVGLKFMQQELGCTQKEAVIAIAEDLKLSEPIISALKDDVPKTTEAFIVKFVEDTFGSLPRITLLMQKMIIKDVFENSDEKSLKISPELKKQIKEWSETKISPKGALYKQKSFLAIRIKMEKFKKAGKFGDGKMDAVLQFLKFSDGDFDISKLTRKEQKQPTIGQP